MSGSNTRLRGAKVANDVTGVDYPAFWAAPARSADPAVRALLRRAADAAPPGHIPIAIVVNDGVDGFVALGVDDFNALTCELRRLRAAQVQS